MLMRKCTTCTMQENGEFCPLRGTPHYPCGFEAEEIERRRNLPMKKNKATKLYSKHVGIRTVTEDVGIH